MVQVISPPMSMAPCPMRRPSNFRPSRDIQWSAHTTNQRRAPTETKVTVDFPGAGTYPVELDYTEWCGLPAVFVLTAVGVGLITGIQL